MIAAHVYNNGAYCPLLCGGARWRGDRVAVLFRYILVRYANCAAERVCRRQVARVTGGG